MSKSRMRVQRLAVSLIAVGLGWRVLRYALGFPIWGDEAFVAVNFLVRDYADMIRPLEYGQIVPLLFMWATLAVYQLLGASEYALRLLPFLAGMASLLLYWRFVRELLPPRAALLALGFLAAAYYPVRHAAEVKPYATDLLLSLLVLLATWWVMRRPQAMGRWLLLSLLAGTTVWASYPIVFISGAAVLVLSWRVWRERPRAAPAFGWLLLTAAFLCSFAAMYVIYAKPHADFAARLTEISMWAKTFPPMAEPWKLPVWFFLIHTGNMFAYPAGSIAPGSLLTFLLFLVGCAQMWRTNRPLLALLLIPFALTFVAAAAQAYPYGGTARTSLYLAPAICLLSGLGLFVTMRFLLGRARLQRGIETAACTFLIVAAIGIVRDIREPFKSQVEKLGQRAVRAAAKQTRPNDKWVIFNATRPVDYAPYLGDWRGTGATFVFDVLRFAPVPVEWAPRPESVQREEGGGVWLFSYRGVKAPFPEDQFAAYLAVLESKLGPPTHEHTLLKRKASEEPGEKVMLIEAIDLYRFEPR